MRCCYAVILWSLLVNAVWANSNEQSGAELRVNTDVQRYYSNLSRFLIPGFKIKLQGHPVSVLRMSRWLDTIFSVPHGRDTINAIIASGNQLTIRDSYWALHSSGRTQAPVSANLINGRGEDVTILFDVRMPDQGSHWVFDRNNQRIEFTAVQSLYHELAHAKHLMAGTWQYADSEGQAIREENLFRQQSAKLRGLPTARLRFGKQGQQYWWPEQKAAAAGLAADE